MWKRVIGNEYKEWKHVHLLLVVVECRISLIIHQGRTMHQKNLFLQSMMNHINSIQFILCFIWMNYFLLFILHYCVALFPFDFPFEHTDYQKTAKIQGPCHTPTFLKYCVTKLILKDIGIYHQDRHDIHRVHLLHYLFIQQITRPAPALIMQLYLYLNK